MGYDYSKLQDNRMRMEVQYCLICLVLFGIRKSVCTILVVRN